MKKLLQFIILLSIAFNSFLYADEPIPDAQMAWQEKANSRYTVQYSQMKNGNWDQPKNIYDSSLDCLHPSITSDPAGGTWISWTLTDGKTSNIAICKMDDGKCLNVDVLRNQMTSNVAPSILADKSGKLWVVWSGFDGKDDEIFYSINEGGHWTEPKQINEDDTYPDILPNLILNDNDRPVVYWYGFNGDKYVEYYSIWNGKNWSSEKTIDDLVSYTDMLAKKKMNLPKLPPFLTTKEKGAIHIKGENSYQSIPINEN
jgi:hypothetical protein